MINKRSYNKTKEKTKTLKKDGSLKKKNIQLQLRKSETAVTVSQLLDQCCNLYVTSPYMLAHIFMNYILNELHSICKKETSRAKIEVINQISLDLSSVVPNLNPFHKKIKGAITTMQNNSSSENCCQDLRTILNESIKIDNSVFCLMEQKRQIYEKLDLPNVTDKAVPLFDTNRTDPNVTESEDQVNVSEEASKPEVNQYFDKNVIRTAALCARKELDILMKKEVNMIIQNPDKVALSKFFDLGSPLMKTCAYKLVCFTSSGRIVQFSFKQNVLPLKSNKTLSLDLNNSPVVDIIIWTNYLIIVTKNGCTYKCSTKCEVVKSFQLNFQAAAVTELQGLLYIASHCGYLNIINLRSMMLFKDGIELGTTVTVMKAAYYKNSTVLISLTENNEIIGRSLVDGVVGSLKFKFTVPDIVSFEIISHIDSPQLVTFFCGTPERVFCLRLENDTLSYGKIINHGTSAILKNDDYIFLGSSDGDLTIINLTNMNAHSFHKILNEKIISLAYLVNLLFISTASCIYSTNIEDLEV